MLKGLCFLLLSVALLSGSVGFCQILPPGSLGGEPTLGWGRIGTPTLHASWAAAGSITASATAAGNLSQSFSNGIYSSTNVDMNAAGEGKLRFDAQGLWLGATIPVRLTNGLTLRVRGEYFFPSRDRIWATAGGNNVVTTRFFFGGIPDPSTTDDRPGHLEFGASTKTRWFFVDAELAYSEAVLGSTSILAGVRYDRLVSTIGPGVSGDVEPPGPLSVNIPGSASVTAELNSVSPYVGIRTSMGGTIERIIFELKGFPCVVFTQARYKKQNGYFGEFKAEYYLPLAGNLSASFFVRGDVIHATFTDLTSFTSLFSLESAISPGSTSSSGNRNAEVSTSIHWKQLAIGGSVNLMF